MKKLSLHVDELEVDSFETASAATTTGMLTHGGGCGWSDDSVCPTVTGRCCPP